MEAFAQSIEGGTIYSWVTSTSWLWPFMEILHFIGLSLLLGALLVIDLRMMGFFRAIDIRAIHTLLLWVFIGFALNLVTGILFFFGDPMRYAVHAGFQLKMVLILLAGINAVWYSWKIHPAMQEWDANVNPPAPAKLVGSISLVLWLSILLLGRLIPYVSTG
jgi:hypothetical protein